ncbi:double zinc ribbon domain-containing protein [Natrarchaeobaculum sulfurireducens]|uniref:Uncharacterized protein n=1 Tax=Natrarchaeobaculum sulfurireducens TaxID=2044521 RepID=A0A346PTI8_9EURY|nr:zinc ribbon domain-containing protein [Natrarchaeobaculum sulfurireducens]AXR82833.1 hypothetical protein AArcMg_2843 [Natrarchaeobaculum sulfurireducens]
MSKITFRADDDLIEELESLEVSKSEALREALRSYLEESSRDRRVDGRTGRDGQTGAIDDLVRDRVDKLLADRLADLGVGQPLRAHAPDTQDVNVTITLEGADATATDESPQAAPQPTDEQPAAPARRQTAQQTQCGQCGEHVDDDHVYCPNCGEKATRRLFCECGDELRSDWSFCPGCGRRTPAADVLESG